MLFFAGCVGWHSAAARKRNSARNSSSTWMKKRNCIKQKA